MFKNKPLENVKWLWADSWYDWVEAGPCMYNNKRYYAKCIDENSDESSSWYRKYLMVDLPEELWRQIDEKHAFFVEKIGSHFDFDENNRRKGHAYLKPSSTWNEYYKKYPWKKEESINIRDYPVIGWFTN